jgi:hypothetical protein
MNDTQPDSSPGGPQPRDLRSLLVLGGALFFISTLFPILASLPSAGAPPAWAGWLDVVLAVVGIGLVVDGASQGKIGEDARQDAYRGYRVLLNLPILLLVVFFVWGNRLKWEVLLPGLAWRTWLLGYVLPARIARWRHSAKA